MSAPATRVRPLATLLTLLAVAPWWWWRCSPSDPHLLDPRRRRPRRSRPSARSPTSRRWRGCRTRSARRRTGSCAIICSPPSPTSGSRPRCSARPPSASASPRRGGGERARALAGRDPSGAVLLVAHYDSVTTAPGAADNGAAVAAVLEALRALRAGRTAAERPARAVQRRRGDRPPGRRGVRGRAPVDGRRGARRQPRGARQRRPVGAGRDPPRQRRADPGVRRRGSLPQRVVAGVRGVRRPAQRHRLHRLQGPGRARLQLRVHPPGGALPHRLDAPAHLELASLQHHGEHLLALVGSLRAVDLRDPTLAAATTPSTSTCCGASSSTTPPPGPCRWRSSRRCSGSASSPGVAGGAGCGCAASPPDSSGSCWLLAAAVGVALATGALLGRLQPALANPWMAASYRPEATMVGFTLATLLVTLVLAVVARRWWRPSELALGGAGGWVALGMAVAVVAPGGSYLLTWPTLTMLVAVAATLRGWSGRARRRAHVALLLAGALPGLLWLPPFAAEGFYAVGLTLAAAVVLLVALGASLLVPLVDTLWGPRGGWVALGLLAATVGAFALGAGRPATTRGSRVRRTRSTWWTPLAARRASSASKANPTSGPRRSSTRAGGGPAGAHGPPAGRLGAAARPGAGPRAPGAAPRGRGRRGGRRPTVADAAPRVRAPRHPPDAARPPAGARRGR
jgi:hypothetical protein